MKDNEETVVKELNYIPRNATGVIKGIAILFMFVLHFFCWPEWYVSGISYPQLAVFAQLFRAPFDICVCLFAFLTGYCYRYEKRKNFQYSLKKCTDIWVTYLAVYLLLLIPAIMTHSISITITSLIEEILALKLPVMYFCWYILFYVMAMIALPIYVAVAKRNPLILILLGIVSPFIVARGYARINPFGNEMVSNLIQNFTPFSVVACGYIFAEFDLFYKLFDPLFNHNVRIKMHKIIVWIALAILAFAGRQICPYFSFGLSISMDVIYAPLFIYAIVNLFEVIHWNRVWNGLAFLGRYSLEMWFFSCGFFNCCKQWSQYILYFPRNPMLVLAWGGDCV